MTKTRDDLKLEKVVKFLRGVGIVPTRSGTNHVHMFTLPDVNGRLRSVPLAESTDVRKMFVPYVQRAIPAYSTQQIYDACKTGKMKYTN